MSRLRRTGSGDLRIPHLAMDVQSMYQMLGANLIPPRTQAMPQIQATNIAPVVGKRELPQWVATIERFVTKHPVWTVIALLLVCIVLTIPVSLISEEVGTEIGSALWVISSIAALVWRSAVLVKKYPEERVKKQPRAVANLSEISGAGMIVKVLFRDLTSPVPEDHDHSSAYHWPFPEYPQVGMRVVVPGMNGPAFAVITAIGASKELLKEIGSDLKTIIRPVSAAEIEQARVQEQADLNSWLDMMRRAAGLSTTSRRRTVPDGFPSIPPAHGNADSVTADEYGRAWWRAYKNARPEEEEAKFKEIGSRWYKIHDSLR